MPLLLGAMAWAVFTRRLPGKVWLVAVVLQGVLLGAAALALWTGEHDEDRVEARAGEAAVDAHERAAKAFTVTAGMAFLAAAVALALRNRPGPFLIAGGASVALSVGMLLLGIQTGTRGGALVHGGAEMVRSNEPGGGGPENGSTEADEEDNGDD
jgi:hypothetical protein